MRIRPFRTFWLDCFSTMLYSIYLATPNANKLFVYNNFYGYTLQEEELPESKKKFKAYLTENDFTMFEKTLLSDEQLVSIWKYDDPIEYITQCLSKYDILMLGVDLFDWVDDTYNYQRNHISHLSLVIGIDEESKCLEVLETGTKGYNRYYVPFDNARKAVMACKEDSYIYNINRNNECIKISKEDIYGNAKHIIETIDNVLIQKNALYDITDLSDMDVTFVFDILTFRLYSLRNRQKVNRLLFMYLFDEKRDGFFSTSFYKLVESYSKISSVVKKRNMEGETGQGIIWGREQMFQLLQREKELWSRFVDNIDDLHFAVSV